MRLISLLGAPAAAALLLVGCGGSDSGSAAGSPEHPMVATTQAAAIASGAGGVAAVRTGKGSSGKTSSATGHAKPGAKSADGSAAVPAGEPTGAVGATKSAPDYQSLLKQKGTPKGSHFTPCNLVSRARAQAILGGPIQRPLEAPQGPTCIYRTTSGKAFVTVAIQGTSYAKVRKALSKPRQLDVGGHAAYCGRLGQPILYVPLSSRRLLTVAAPCAVAKAFAATAVQNLAG